MPAKPKWFGRLDEIIDELAALPSPAVTRGRIEFLLGVGPRRAQQIMAPCGTEQVGTSTVADRQLLIRRLRALAHGETAHYEVERRRNFAKTLESLRQGWLTAPKVLVEAPVAAVNQELDDLPAGIELAPGRIALTFATPAEALEKLLALAMAIGRDMRRFEEIITPDAPTARNSHQRL
jgi:hypothetical protein